MMSKKMEVGSWLWRKKMSKNKKYHLRVRVTYEDVVEVKAKNFHEAQYIAEQSVFERMNDDVEPCTDIEEYDPNA